MTGLDKILAQLDAESQARCRQLQENAEREAQAILDQAQADADAMRAQRAAALEKKLENTAQSAESTAQLRRNQIVLKGKLEAIDDTLTRALEVIRALPKKEYFDILKELIVQNALPGKGVLRLNAADAERLPQNFLSSVNTALAAKNSEVMLGDSAELDSGFLLIYGDIDINCTFSAIASAKRDALRDTLNRLLFS